VKSTLNSEEKQAIGALAAARIAKNSCIYLDAGTTPLALAGPFSTVMIYRWSLTILK
jgi:DeoR/GlpR family transcriptional regulator of sugar metabolism